LRSDPKLTYDHATPAPRSGPWVDVIVRVGRIEVLPPTDVAGYGPTTVGNSTCHPKRMPYNPDARKEIRMAESTITSKGQTTVPAEIRALVHAKPGTRLVWSVMPDGTIIVRAKTKSILDMAGMLKAPKGKRVSVEEMNPWR
jgi:AbrB family looped-hinge helix DNA binding protein